MVDVVQQNNIVLNTDTDVFEYIEGIVANPRTPFERQSAVNITNRSALPAGVASFNVGKVMECPSSQSICWVLVLNDDGNVAVVAIPKAHLTART